VYIPQLAVMTAVLLYCIVLYCIVLYYIASSAVGLPLCFEHREILIVIFCPVLLSLIALLARIAVSGFFRAELTIERCSLDICKDWGDRPITRLLAPNTHTHTHAHRACIRTADSHTDTFAIFQTTQTNTAQCLCGLEVQCCTLCSKSS
jgi:hypothetical protein